MDSAIAMSSRCWLLCATPSPGRMHSMFTIFSNGSIIPPGFKFTELHALTLAARLCALDKSLVHQQAYEKVVYTRLQKPLTVLTY